MAQTTCHRAFAVGHFPPPVHGMSVATKAFVDLLDSSSEVIRVDVSGRSLGRGPGHHLTRVARTVRGAGTLIRRSSPGDAVYVGCDAGPGMLYTLVIAITARCLRLRMFAHHHSYAYVDNRSTLMASVVRAAGRTAIHIFTCADQATRFSANYPSASRTVILPITFVLDRRSTATAERPQVRARVVLGHMGNLTVEKGLLLAFDTLAAARAAGIDAELLLAGPSPTDADAVTLASALQSTEFARHIGPIYDAGKERFFGQIDVFLFPTMYRHESFGLVAAEAMASGVPVVAYRAGCLDSAWVGAGGLVLEPVESFAPRAVDQLAQWIADPSSFVKASGSARSRADAARESGLRSAAQLVRRISSGSDMPEDDEGL